VGGVVRLPEIAPRFAEVNGFLRFREASSLKFHDRLNALNHVQAGTAQIVYHLLDVAARRVRAPRTLKNSVELLA